MPLAEEGDINVLDREDATSENWDTIIIASVSEKNKRIRMINIPRDIYMDYSEDILSQLRKSPKLYEAKGFQKINAPIRLGRGSVMRTARVISETVISIFADLIL